MLLISVGLNLANLQPGNVRNGVAHGVSVEFNETLIRSWQTPLNLENPDAVFEVVLRSIGREARVYPSENYYYFRLNASGRTIAGNIQLDARDRDKGIVTFTYYDVIGYGASSEKFVSVIYSIEKGVKVTRESEYRYNVAFRGVGVNFILTPQQLDLPPSTQLADGEVFVGPVQDESGVRFLLLFNQKTNHFMYLIDDSAAMVEPFTDPIDDISFGIRTGFAYFTDRALNRRILIGVHELNRMQNNYYDGPFDQLPDNHADKVNIRRFVSLAYPGVEIDRYGHLSDDPETRIAIAPYTGYHDRADLDFISRCRQTLSGPLFYACITPDPRKQSQDPAAPSTMGTPPLAVPQITP